MDLQCLYAMAAIARQPPLRHVPGLLHHVSLHEDEVAHGSIRLAGLGIIHLFRHHHRGRPYLEIHHPGLYPPHHRRTRASLPGEIPARRSDHGPLRSPAAAEQPSADDLLLPLPHPLPCDSMGCDSLEGEESGPMGHRHRTRPAGRNPGRGGKLRLALQQL